MEKILSETTIFEDRLVVQKAEISMNDEVFSRLRLKREEAAAVLLYNPDTDKVILTKQFRYPIAEKESAPILEIVAGKVDGDEEHIRTAIRETEEEAGYVLNPDKMTYLLSSYASPGYTSELCHMYYAEVRNSDKKAQGGGLEEEHESIELVELDRVEFIRLLLDGQLRDAKTYVAGLHVLATGRLKI